jgi:hypothetical protein
MVQVVKLANGFLSALYNAKWWFVFAVNFCLSPLFEKVESEE